MQYDISGKRVWIAGHRGMVGSAIIRRLSNENCILLTADRDEVDLTNQAAVEAWIQHHRPQVVVAAAAKVGGIFANDAFPADFLYVNLMIEANLVHAAYESKVEKMLFLGSSCIYPKFAEQPINEGALLTGPLEPTNAWYALAKIAGIKLCQAYRRQHGCDFIAAMPTNLYGPGDNFHPENSHVPAALLDRFHRARIEGQKQVSVWGSGKPLREFLYVDDLADACVFLIRNYSDEQIINIGTGVEISINDFAHLVARTVGYEGDIFFDTSKPDGTPRKRLDVSRLEKLGWTAQMSLSEGLRQYYRWYLSNMRSLRK